MDVSFTNNLCAMFLAQVNWHTSKAMQSRVEMNDAEASPLTALCSCASELVSKHGFVNKKRSQNKKGGEHKNGTKHTDTANERKS